MDPRFTIPLTDPRLGEELLKDDRSGSLALNVWVRYCQQYTGVNESLPVYGWCLDRSWPRPIGAQEAVDKAEPLVSEMIQHLESGSADKALKSARSAWQYLFLGCSDFQRGRGQPAKMRFPALRAYTIRKFNPHPKSPKDSSVSWHRVADMLFKNDGKCSRCSIARHNSDSPCVKTLMEAVARLKAAMKRDGIPI